jgi:hypothetical protein
MSDENIEPECANKYTREKWFEHLQKMEENTIQNILLQENSHSNI